LLSFGNKIKKVVFCFAFRSLIRNFATKVANFLLNASEQVRILHFGIKKKQVSFVLHSIFRNFATKNTE